MAVPGPPVPCRPRAGSGVPDRLPGGPGALPREADATLAGGTREAPRARCARGRPRDKGTPQPVRKLAAPAAQGSSAGPAVCVRGGFPV